MKSTGTTGMNAVDWEARVDFDRLRTERLLRLKAQLDKSDVGALLACVGIFFGVALKNLTSHSLIAAKDPRIARALSFEQV